MTADESGPLSGSTPAAKQFLSGNTSQDGDLRQQPDIDTRPVGRCFNELTRLKNLIKQARAVDAAMQDALTAFWRCRDATDETPADDVLQGLRDFNRAQIFDSRAELLDRIKGYTETPE